MPLKIVPFFAAFVKCVFAVFARMETKNVRSTGKSEQDRAKNVRRSKKCGVKKLKTGFLTPQVMHIQSFSCRILCRTRGRIYPWQLLRICTSMRPPERAPASLCRSSGRICRSRSLRMSISSRRLPVRVRGLPAAVAADPSGTGCPRCRPCPEPC